MSDSRNWQVSINDPLKRVEGAEDMAQCVYTILTTVPGTDPLRPAFGSNLYKYIDRPMTEAQPMLIYEITTAVARWETRIKVKTCRLTATAPERRTVEITAEVARSAAQITITVNI